MEELYKNYLNDPDNHDGVITQLEPDILECKVTWAWESITVNKANVGDGIPVELFQIRKDDAVSTALNRPGNMETSAVATGLEMVSFITIPMKGNAKEHWNDCTMAIISHTTKGMLQILSARLQKTMNWEIPDIHAEFNKEEPEIKLEISIVLQKKQESTRNTSTSVSLTTPKSLRGSQQIVEHSFFFFLFVVNFVIHWNETAMGLHVFPIPIPPPTSLSTRSPEVFPVHQVRALVSCIQPGLVICFTLDTIHVLMLFSWNIPPSPSPTESKRLFYKSVSLFLYIIIFIQPSSSISLKYSCPSISVGDCF